MLSQQLSLSSIFEFLDFSLFLCNSWNFSEFKKINVLKVYSKKYLKRQNPIIQYLKSSSIHEFEIES